MMNPNSSLVPNDFLTEAGRVSRPPLRTWARALLARLESGEAAAGNWLNVSGCLNNASLIEIYRGNQRSARELCEVQLRCAENLIRFHDPNVFVEFVVQPWVNLGRILRLQRQFERALEYFAVFLEVMTDKSPRIWPLEIEPATWRKYADAQSVFSFVQAVYIVDSAKTFLAAQNPLGAARFLRSARLLPGSESSLLLDEAELITLFRLGQHEEAMALTESSSWQREGYSKLVRVTYRVAILAASGSMDSAYRLGLQLSERVLKTDWSAPKDQQVLRYLHYFGKVLLEVGLPELAASVWHTGLQASRHLVDVPLQLALLDSILAMDNIAAREALEDQRTALLRECLYVPLLALRGLDVDPIAAMDPLFEKLRNQLEYIALASAPKTLGRVATEDPMRSSSRESNLSKAPLASP